jgi:predicted nucleotidyltransferase component of viral defense system
MGKTILTPKQLNFLELVQLTPSLRKRFYLTGGTALAEFYLKHRLSEDIDLFTENEEVNHSLTDAFLRRISPKLSVAHIKRSQFLGLVSYKLVYKDKEELKVDFNYYPFPRIDKRTKFKGLEVDSIYDIAANKLHTLFMKPRSRDYVDLFFIMKQGKYDLNKLILDAKAKFDWDIDRINLINQFVRVKDIKETEFPRMLIPFRKSDLEKFFLEKAKELGKDILK